jgi:hypothetical protein
MIVMNNITFAEAEAGHRELWGWLSEADVDTGPNHLWPGWYDYDREAIHSCFACELALEFMSPDCEVCPIEWPDGKYCTDNGSLFKMWHSEKDHAVRKRLAAKIRDLPWRKK